MTNHDVAVRVADIESNKDNVRLARGMEERLWKDVLVFIASANDLPLIDIDTLSSLAREALKTLEIQFSDWSD
jgi:hypothetical protein